MRLTSIHATNFLGAADVDVDLYGIEDLVIVGPNMAGKSTLLDAVTWALFNHLHRPGIRASGDKVIRDGADLAMVDIHFIAGGRDIEVIREKPRGKTGTLSLMVDGEQETRHTIDETFAAIEGYVGMSLGGLLAGPWMLQKSADSFMAMQPRDRKDLLIRLLGLDVYERLHEAAKREKNEWEAARKAADDRSVALAAQLEATRGVVEEVAHAEDEVTRTRAEVNEATAEWTAAREKAAAAEAADAAFESVMSRIARLFEQKRSTEQGLEAAKANALSLAQPKGERPKLLAPVTDEDVTRARERLSAAREARERYLQSDQRLTAAQAAVERVARSTAIIDTVPCQTILHQPEEMEACRSCQFLTDAVAQREELPALVTERDLAHQAKEEASVSEVDQIPVLAHQLDEWQDTQRRYFESKTAVEVWDANEAKRAGLHEAAVERCAELGQRLADIESEWNAAQAEAVPLREAHDAAGDLRAEVGQRAMMKTAADRALIVAEERWRNLLAAQARREAAQSELDEVTATRKHAEEQAYTYRILALAFGRDGIPTNIIEATIPVIEAAANEVLDRLPGDMRLTLSTQRESKTGGMIDRLEVVVTTDGWERDYGLLSVGGRFRIDLALRLGLSRVLSHRTGKPVETLWLDEPLADLDAEAREAVIETLAAVRSEFGLAVVTSHHPEFNDHFSHVLNVSMENGVTTAVLA